MIAIIDFGVSNVASVANMVKKVGGLPIIISDKEELQSLKADKLIFPGIGSFEKRVEMRRNENIYLINSHPIQIDVCHLFHNYVHGEEKHHLASFLSPRNWMW